MSAEHNWGIYWGLDMVPLLLHTRARAGNHERKTKKITLHWFE